MKRIICLFLSVLFVLGLCSCSTNTSKMYSKTFTDLFDTSCTISAFDESESSFNEHFDLVYNELKAYSNYLDIYNQHKDNLYTLNKDKKINSSPFLSDFLTYSKNAFDLTNGRVNIAFGAVLSPWHDARELALNTPDKAYLPDVNVLKALSNHTDINCLNITDSSITITDKDMTIDAGAVAKGYACEKIADFILSNSIWSDCVINLGGNVKVLGTKNGESFNIAVENPSSADYLCTVKASNGDSIVTSGNYERYFELDGKRYCHIIDTDTFTPCDYSISVTVVSKDAALADVMSTYLFTLPADKAIDVANKNKDISVMILDKNEKIYKTSNWRSN